MKGGKNFVISYNNIHEGRQFLPFDFNQVKFCVEMRHDICNSLTEKAFTFYILPYD